jgi:hypothetical protein
VVLRVRLESHGAHGAEGEEVVDANPLCSVLPLTQVAGDGELDGGRRGRDGDQIDGNVVGILESIL